MKIELGCHVDYYSSVVAHTVKVRKPPAPLDAVALKLLPCYLLLHKTDTVVLDTGTYGIPGI